MKYLCVFDMDDTLLAPDKSVPFDNMQALEKLHELGIGVTIATGRSGFLIGKFIDLLSIELPVVTCNGGMLVSPDLKQVVWENPIVDHELRKLLTYLFDQKADFLAYSSTMIYCPPESQGIKLFTDYNKTVPEHRKAPITHLTPAILEGTLPAISKILLYYPTPEQGQYLRSLPGLEVLASMSHVLDIMQAGSTKGNAVLSLAKHLNIPIENVAVFGDNENDISMFSCGALSVAMGNSHPELKKLADFIAGDAVNAGVAQGLHEFVLPKFGFSI